MTTIASAIQRKQHKLVTVTPETTVLEALNIMAEKNIGSVVVMNGNEYAGVMTERDYSRKVILKGKDSTSTSVTEIMSTDLPKISPQDKLDYCMQEMTSKNIRYMPVFENERIVGIISMSDVVKSIIHAQKETIDQLQSYISS
jgi:CBS domain-containing protein